jgi:AraC-like DNA-binding protein
LRLLAIEEAIECFSRGSAENETSAARRDRGILARFEDLLAAGPALRMAEMLAALGASDRLLRDCCNKQLGMTSSLYRRRRRMQQLHRALRDLNREIAGVSMVAERYGYQDLGRLATNYRAIYGELRSGDVAASLSTGSDGARCRPSAHKTFITRAERAISQRRALLAVFAVFYQPAAARSRAEIVGCRWPWNDRTACALAVLRCFWLLIVHML